MAEIIKLTATPRSVHGTRPSRRLRAEGKVPGVVYGLGTDPEPVTVEWRELRAALVTDQGLNAVIHIEVDGKTGPTLVKDMQRHPVRRDVLHVDFLRVDLDKPVDVEVSLVLEGEALAVTQNDGRIEQTLNALLVTSKPDAIPPQITVDISGLEIGHAIRVGDLELPEGVTTHVDPEEAIVVGQAGISEAELEAAEAEAAGLPEGLDELIEAEGEGDEGAQGEAGETAGAEEAEGGEPSGDDAAE
jgi:large subunit ribosomal protein L25